MRMSQRIRRCLPSLIQLFGKENMTWEAHQGYIILTKDKFPKYQCRRS